MDAWGAGLSRSLLSIASREKIEPFKGAHVRRIAAKEAIEIAEVRASLEKLVVRHAAERATEDHMADLRQALRAAQEIPANEAAIKLGPAARGVREEIWRISGHETGRHILSTLNTQLIRIWIHANVQPGRFEQILSDIERAVTAIEANDPDAAVAAIGAYHDHFQANLLRALEASSGRRA
jgi:DNA-binding GntR family transcriptional regulator